MVGLDIMLGSAISFQYEILEYGHRINDIARFKEVKVKSERSARI